MSDKKESQAKIEPPKPGSCQFYLLHKRRYCKFPPPSGEEFCAQHLTPDESGQFEMKGKKRVPCPLDSNHSVYEHKLSSHLKKCNSKAPPISAFHSENINSGCITEPEPSNILLSEVDIEYVRDLVDKLIQVYNENIKLEERIEEHEALKEDLTNPLHQKCLKHRKQEASLLGNMERSHWLTDGTAYIEFGAGRARLTSYLLDTISGHSNSTVLLVDRDTTRNKCENKYKYIEGGPSLERLRIDIKDLALEKHSFVDGSNRQIVAYSKHLCGSATDLTLRCLERVLTADSRTSEESDCKKRKLTNNNRVKGIQIALCCHHKCTWRAYVGKEFWFRHALTPQDYVLTRTLSSWATCAFPDRAREDSSEHASAAASTTDADFNRFPFWTSEKKETVGKICKRVIDIGREYFLRNLGFTTNLVVYVNRDISLENVMLVANK